MTQPLQGLLLVVDDITLPRDELIGRGVDVSEVWHLDPNKGRVPGVDPERRSYSSRATFADPDGNEWQLQEATERLRDACAPGPRPACIAHVVVAPVGPRARVVEPETRFPTGGLRLSHLGNYLPLPHPKRTEGMRGRIQARAGPSLLPARSEAGREVDGMAIVAGSVTLLELIEMTVRVAVLVAMTRAPPGMTRDRAAAHRGAVGSAG